jgi:hypothetical protein
MELASKFDEHISTRSIEDGLDFGCNLLCSALQSRGDADPALAQALLRGLTQYLRLRYAGELGLSLEYLAGLGHQCSPENFRHAQFWSQLRWIANEMGLSGSELDDLALPSGVLPSGGA